MRKMLLAVALTLVLGSCTGVYTPGESPPPTSAVHQEMFGIGTAVTDSLSQRQATDLCTWFRPGGRGYVVFAKQTSAGWAIVCIMKTSANPPRCTYYEVRGWGGAFWNGPYAVSASACP
jgi:hypothetical protein